NIVLILADDFGVGDIQTHYPDNKIATPFLDQLVQDGMSFTDAHSPSAVCTPTRYGLLTGRYSWRTRLQEWVLAAYEPPLIDADRPTLPGMLREHGYETAMIGKWHLGWDWPGPQPSRMTEVRNGQKTLEWHLDKPVLNGPTTRGFDYYFGVDLPNMPPFSYVENDTVTPVPTSAYVHDESEGVVLPRGFVGSPMAPGWQLREIVPELTRRAVEQVHSRARGDKPFFLFYSMTSPHEPVSPSPAFQGQSGIAPIADFVMETDWSVGQVVRAVDEAGIADDTVVIFTADNGHSHYTGWESLIEAGHLPSGPYRGHKGDIWEGGHRIPLVVRWPGKIAAHSQSRQLVSLTDIFATSLALAGTDLPAAGAEDSVSFLDAALGKIPEQGRTSLVSHSNHGEFAYRDGPWKLVFRNSGPNLQRSRGKPTVPELYNLSDDIAESKNLAEERPEIVEELQAKFDAMIARGATRAGITARNDTDVQYATTQEVRWAPAAE
ncbi:MAG: arylsulfatase, partial [Bryobacterales bacterium]|nr:arylsulfatase [Bryobacterales bacterium]